MATDVTVDIDDQLIIAALNTPGGGVYEWRDKTATKIADLAMTWSQVNDILNARHRAGWTGEFKASWYWRRFGNQHRVQAEIGNAANHAVFVEEGRSTSFKYQRFSWTEWNGEVNSVGGEHGTHGVGTGMRPGKHLLKNATNAVMPEATGGSYTPLV